MGERKLEAKYPLTVVPEGRRLLCRRQPEVTSGVLFIPEKYIGASLLYEVLEKGPLCIWDWIKVGDFVFTGIHGSTPIPLYQQKDIYIINEDDVLPRVTEFYTEKEEETHAA